LTETFGLLD